MDILDFVKQFDLKHSLIKNIGHEFYNNQIVMTIDLYNKLQLGYDANNQKQIIGSLIFSEVNEIGVHPEIFTLNNNEIIDVKHEIVVDSIIINFNFTAPDIESFVKLSFKSKEVEWEQLNFHYEYNFSE